MIENQKTTVTINKEQQSFEVNNGQNKSAVVIAADKITLSGSVVLNAKLEN